MKHELYLKYIQATHLLKRISLTEGDEWIIHVHHNNKKMGGWEFWAEHISILDL